MIVTVYMRVARHERARSPEKAMVKASTQPNYMALETSNGEVLPTAMFALELDVPNNLLEQAEQVLAQITVREKDAKIAAQVREVEDNDGDS